VLTPSPPSEDATDNAPAASSDGQEIARNVHAFKARARGRGRGGRPGFSGRTSSIQGSECVIFPAHPPFEATTSLIRPTYSSDSAAASPSGKKKNAKVMRKWGDEQLSETDMSAFDHSTDKPSSNDLQDGAIDLDALVDRASMGARNKDGLYEVQDWILGETDAPPSAQSAPTSTWSSVFARFTGGKVLTEADLTPALNAMKEHLMKKNVAKEIADKVCESVGESLIGKKVSGFKSG